MPEELSIEFDIPPAWWWTQSAAARLEAERQSPLDISGVDISVSRIGLWRYGKSGRFRAVFRRAETGASQNGAEPAGAVRRSDIAVGLLSVSAVVAAIAASPLRPFEERAPTETQQQRSSEIAYAPTAVMLADVAEVFGQLAPSAQVVRLEWSPGQISIGGSGLSPALAEAVSAERPGLQVEIAADGERQ